MKIILYLCPLNTGISLGGGAGATFVENKERSVMLILRSET